MPTKSKQAAGTGPVETGVSKPSKKSTRSASATPSPAYQETCERLLEENVKLEQQQAVEKQKFLEQQQAYNELLLKNSLDSMALLWSGIVDQHKDIICQWFLEHPEVPSPTNMQPKEFIKLFLKCAPHIQEEHESGSRRYWDSVGLQFRQFRTAMQEVVPKHPKRKYEKPKDAVSLLHWDEVCFEEYCERLKTTHTHLGMDRWVGK